MARCKRCAAKISKLEAELKTAKLRVETAKLAQIEAVTAAKLEAQSPKYMRYEDMPPPTPEDEARFHARFQEIMKNIRDAREDGRSLVTPPKT